MKNTSSGSNRNDNGSKGNKNDNSRPAKPKDPKTTSTSGADKSGSPKTGTASDSNRQEEIEDRLEH